jgi:alpha-galactosidase
VCEALTRLTSIKNVGLCHGVFQGLSQIARIVEVAVEDIDAAACGINHFTWFQRIGQRSTGEDLYPRLREAEKEGHWLSDWDELALGRILFRRFGLWPSPATNHYGEYIRWADEFWPSQVEYFYDPAEGHPWKTGEIPEFVYSLGGEHSMTPGPGPWRRPKPTPPSFYEQALQPSGELSVPLMEALVADVPQTLDAVNVLNDGAIPNLPDDLVVEVPAVANAKGLRPTQMEALPEVVAALICTQASIHKLLVEAYAENSKEKLLQAVLLEPTVDSYRRAVECVDEMIALQRHMLPEFE